MTKRSVICLKGVKVRARALSCIYVLYISRYRRVNIGLFLVSFFNFDRTLLVSGRDILPGESIPMVRPSRRVGCYGPDLDCQSPCSETSIG